ncbi:MAG: cysteine--tRNA ligase, partial [Patescibacteria group bacterium]|nr:cysteine--tRNA ligase [Patescibacteria group bacterium]
MLKLFNTLSRKKEIFKPLKNKKVGLYTCGPTVYWFAHIGNLRTYLFEDILKRTLEYNKFKVKHIMNITDVGHLTSDADTGEDKIEKGAKREKKSAEEIVDYYTKAFEKDIERLEIKTPDLLPKATDHIKEQINLIKVLEKKGFVYQILDGIYFNTSKIKDYGKLAGLKKVKRKSCARIKPSVDKKNPRDFALWKFTPAGIKRQMEWDSPWGKGFPGWHTECVVMSIKYLGIPFDIHCGGIDHISIHHTNEIAQAEAAYEKNLSNYWLHGEFLVLEKGRMGKSEGNIIILDDLIKKNFNPLAYRYLCLGTHYRKKLAFSWRSLQYAQNTLDKLYEKFAEIKSGTTTEKKDISKKDISLSMSLSSNYLKKFLNFIDNDLNTPRALALMWDMLKDKKIS